MLAIRVLNLRCPLMAGLERTTDSKGLLIVFEQSPLMTPVTGQIRERNWYGPDGMEHVRTVREPKQSIPTFTETIDLLMRVSAAAMDILIRTLTSCSL